MKKITCTVELRGEPCTVEAYNTEEVEWVYDKETGIEIPFDSISPSEWGDIYQALGENQCSRAEALHEAMEDR